jgi:hypothetical protein
MPAHQDVNGLPSTLLPAKDACMRVDYKAAKEARKKVETECGGFLGEGG